MFSFFKKSKKEILGEIPTDFSFLGCDMHSHLVPDIDDGSRSLEMSMVFIKALKSLGYRKLITTPHIHLEFYDNRKDKIEAHFEQLRRDLDANGIEIELGIGAEYYLDNLFLSGILPEGMLSFSEKQVLVEVSMAGWPRNFSDILFTIQSQGYRPILAHPERYIYEADIKVYEQLKSKGVTMQMNMLAPAGYYGKTVQLLAERLMEHQIYDYCGTDLHHERHLDTIFRVKGNDQLMAKLFAYGFKNNTL